MSLHRDFPPLQTIRTVLLTSAMALALGTVAAPDRALAQQPLSKEEEAKQKAKQQHNQRQQPQQGQQAKPPGEPQVGPKVGPPGRPPRDAGEGPQPRRQGPGPDGARQAAPPPPPPPPPNARPPGPPPQPFVARPPQGGPPPADGRPPRGPGSDSGRTFGQPKPPETLPPPVQREGAPARFLPKPGGPTAAGGAAGAPGATGRPSGPVPSGPVPSGPAPGIAKPVDKGPVPTGQPAAAGAPGAASGAGVSGAAGGTPPPGGARPFLPPGTPVTTPAVQRAAPTGPARLDDVRTSRVESVDKSGRKIIEEPGNRTIIRQGNQVIIHKDETKIVQNFYPNARSTRGADGLTQTVYVRPDGVRVVSVTDGSGRLVRRFGQTPQGREIVYVDNRRFYRNVAIGVGIAAVGIGVALALAPPVHAIPRERYIVEYDRASDEIIYETLMAPPVERLERVYSLDEVLHSYPLRQRMRRVDLDTIHFETGSFEVAPDQYRKLERIARAMGRVIERNPGEVFLIEGHTDAVGPAEDNLSLSDRRAEAVARVLTDYFSIPIENLVTQGYGEQFLKVPTQGPEPANRIVVVRRITPMLSQEEGAPQ